MTENFPPADTPRQQRVTELVEQGIPLAAAVGRAAAEQAGYTPLPAHGVDKPGTRREGT
jgi:hypothetical protein